jgi:hypothetical protein
MIDQEKKGDNRNGAIVRYGAVNYYKRFRLRSRKTAQMDVKPPIWWNI